MKRILTVIALLFSVTCTFAQIEGHVNWAYGAKKTGTTEAVVLLKADIDNGWHIYSTNVNGGPKTSFKFASSKDYTLVGKLAEPAPVNKYDKTAMLNLSYFEHSVTFQQKVNLTGKKATVKGTLEYIACNDRKCLPPESVDFNVQVAL